MLVNIAEEHVVELHEILCEIPFEEPTLYDIEPPTERHPAVESLIDHLEQHIELQNQEEEE